MSRCNIGNNMCSLAPQEKLKKLKEIILTPNTYTVLFYYMPGCPHCEHFKPLIEKLTRACVSSGKTNIQIVMINSDTSPDICANNIMGTGPVRGFPQTFLFQNGRMLKEFSISGNDPEGLNKLRTKISL